VRFICHSWLGFLLNFTHRCHTWRCYRDPSNRITANQPLQQVTNTGGIDLRWWCENVSNIPCRNRAAQLGGRAFKLSRLISMLKAGKQTTSASPTISPPELELRADKVTLTGNALRDRTRRPDSVWCSTKGCPVPRNETVIDRTERDTSPDWLWL